MTRIRVAGTVDVALARELDQEHEERKREAAETNAEVPDYSDTLEFIIKKGLVSARRQYLCNKALNRPEPQPSSKEAT